MLGSLIVKWGTCRICISEISQQRCPVVIYFMRQTLHGGGDMFTRVLHLVHVFLENTLRCMGLLCIAQDQKLLVTVKMVLLSQQQAESTS